MHPICTPPSVGSSTKARSSGGQHAALQHRLQPVLLRRPLLAVVEDPDGSRAAISRQRSSSASITATPAFMSLAPQPYTRPSRMSVGWPSRSARCPGARPAPPSAAPPRPSRAGSQTTEFADPGDGPRPPRPRSGAPPVGDLLLVARLAGDRARKLQRQLVRVRRRWPCSRRAPPSYLHVEGAQHVVQRGLAVRGLLALADDQRARDVVLPGGNSLGWVPGITTERAGTRPFVTAGRCR
jgi:hypothetical protein